MFIDDHALRLTCGVVQMTPMAAELPATRGLRPGTPHCRLHAGFWLLAAVDPLGATVELAGPQSPSPNHPSAHWKRLFLSTIHIFPSFRIPSQPTRQTISYQTIYPCDTACNPHPTFRSTVFPAAARHFFSPQPDPTSRHPKHPTPPLRQALYLGSPPSSASLVHHTHPVVRHFRYRHQHFLPCNLQPGLHVNINIFFTS